MRILKKLQLGRLVTPIPDRKRPVYRWFQLKESFSSGLVLMLCDLWKPSRESVILDPFCGAGTTLLASKEAGVPSIGLDVPPLFLMASRAKTAEYDVDELRRLAREVLAAERKPVETPEWVRRYFPPTVPEEIASLREEISRLQGREKDFFLLALVRAGVRCSWAEVDGAAIKVRRRKVRPLREVLGSVISEMLADLQELRTQNVEVRVERGDARRMDLPDESVDMVVTSPPYLFKGEYTSAHRLEEWISGLRPDPGEFFGEPAEDAEKYFSDMADFLKELGRVLRPKARACLAISDGCSKSGVVRVLDRICELLDGTGLVAKSAVLVNERWCTTPSRRKLGRAGEYLLTVEKK